MISYLWTLLAITGANAGFALGSGPQIVNPGSPCSALPNGTGPLTKPDTPAAFVMNKVYSGLAESAKTPENYELSFKNLHAVDYNKQIMTHTIKTYNPAVCADICKNMHGCVSFNIYYVRGPSINPGRACPDPESVTNINCRYSTTKTVEDEATYSSGKLVDFEIVVAGSNAYNFDGSQSSSSSSSEVTRSISATSFRSDSLRSHESSHTKKPASATSSPISDPLLTSGDFGHHSSSYPSSLSSKAPGLSTSHENTPLPTRSYSLGRTSSTPGLAAHNSTRASSSHSRVSVPVLEQASPHSGSSTISLKTNPSSESSVATSSPSLSRPAAVQAISSATRSPSGSSFHQVSVSPSNAFPTSTLAAVFESSSRPTSALSVKASSVSSRPSVTLPSTSLFVSLTKPRSSSHSSILSDAPSTPASFSKFTSSLHPSVVSQSLSLSPSLSKSASSMHSSILSPLLSPTISPSSSSLLFPSLTATTTSRPTKGGGDFNASVSPAVPPASSAKSSSAGALSISIQPANGVKSSTSLSVSVILSSMPMASISADGNSANIKSRSSLSFFTTETFLLTSSSTSRTSSSASSKSSSRISSSSPSSSTIPTTSSVTLSNSSISSMISVSSSTKPFTTLLVLSNSSSTHPSTPSPTGLTASFTIRSTASISVSSSILSTIVTSRPTASS